MERHLPCAQRRHLPCAQRVSVLSLRPLRAVRCGVFVLVQQRQALPQPHLAPLSHMHTETPLLLPSWLPPHRAVHAGHTIVGTAGAVAEGVQRAWDATVAVTQVGAAVLHVVGVVSGAHKQQQQQQEEQERQGQQQRGGGDGGGAAAVPEADNGKED
jgi:hypothetical protein